MKDDFSSQVGAWCDLAGARARVAFLAIAYGAQARVKQLTPVDTGYLRANWQVVRGGQAIPVERIPRQKNEDTDRETATSIAGAVAGMVGGTVGTMAGGALGGPGGAIAGMVALSQAATMIAEEMAGRSYDAANARPPLAEVQLGEKLHIVNPTNYARVIEFGREMIGQDGKARKVAPRAMAQQTVAEMPEIAAQAIAPFVVRG
jgi:hypothetical protein